MSDGTKTRVVATDVAADVSFTAQESSECTKDFPPHGGPGMTALALWSWYPGERDSDELLFPRGAELEEVFDVNGDWFHGVYLGARGLFPSTYVKILTRDESNSS